MRRGSGDGSALRVMLWISAGVCFLTLLGLGQVYLRLQMISTGYQISRETRHRHALEEQNQKLRLELSTRMDPVLIERVAREDLLMTEPDPRAIRVIRKRAAPVAVARVGGADRP